MDRTQDAARAFLRSYREVRAERRQLERRLDGLRSEAEHITANYNGQPGGGGDPHKDSLLVEISDRSEALDELIKACWRREDLVGEFIQELEDYRHRAILRFRYIECLRWTSVVEELKTVGLFYDERQVYRLHGVALQEARKAWPEWVKRHPELKEEET